MTRTGAAAGSDLRWWATALALAACGVAALIWVGRGTLFSVDDLLWFMSSPGLDLEGVLQPHNGHLIATSRVVYHLVFEAFGAEYAPIRVLTAVAAAGSALLLFVWARRRVGPAVALAGMALLLFLGTSYIFLIAGDGLMVQLALVAGLGALLALERRDRAGDVLACALLSFGVLTYSIALGFVVAAAVAVILTRGRDRLWIAAVPALLYAAWWVWSQEQPNTTGEDVEILNLLLAPAFAFETVASALGALTGLDYEFAAEPVRPEFDTTAPVAGRALVLGAVLAFVWRARRFRMPAAAWVALGYLVTLCVLGSLTSDAASPPHATRFVLFTSVGVLLVASAAAAGVRWTRGRTAVVWIVAACGIATNFSLLLDGGEFRRDVDEPQLRAELTGIELAGERALPRPDLSQVAGGAAVINHPFAFAKLEDPSGDYLAAVAEYGRLGYTLVELRMQPEELRARTDATLAGAYGRALTPLPRARPLRGCEPRGTRASDVEIELPAGRVFLEARRAPAVVEVRRFATQTRVQIGTLPPGKPAKLKIPADTAPDPWYVHVNGGAPLVCPYQDVRP